MTDDARLLPRYRTTTHATTTTRRLDQHLAQLHDRDTTTTEHVNAGRTTDPDDPDVRHRQMRMIPITAKGIGSTVPGTNPVAELLRNNRDSRYSHRNR